MNTIPAFQLNNITKRFPGVIANDSVTFGAQKGEIHALLGENGAGKSTLMNVLCGLYQADEGTIHINGEPVTFQSPGDAIDAGIGMVHQHFMLVPSQTVAENVILGLQDVPFVLNPKQVAQEVKRIGEQYGLPIDSDAKVWQLSVGEQQRIEIIKMLYRGAEILILDEPTAVLTPQEVEEFFVTLRSMVADGKTIIFISHKLDEVLSIADRITVLRGGKVAATVDAEGMTKSELASLMVGREVLFQLDKPTMTAGDVRLQLDDVHALDNKGLPALNDLSLTVRSGEIVGIAGVAGNGQRELAEVICGLRASIGGTISVAQADASQHDVQDVTNAPPVTMIEAGIAYVPEDRSATGSAPNHSIAENLILRTYRTATFGQGWWLNRRKMKQQAVELIASYDIATPNAETPARKLSGGNLQKVILAREISSNPNVLIAAYPSRGLDIGATENVRKLLLEERNQGAAILLISEDLDEIFELSDRIVAMFHGEIMGEVDMNQVEDAQMDGIRERVGLMMAGERG
ncbi:MAG: ABC transporter ATP-binding protein [Chloroflexota bacterium]